MKAFVTGATGFVGQEVLKELHAAGHGIRILARGNSQAAQNLAARFGAEIHEGDILDAASLPGGLRDIDAIIHLVGIISECGEQTFENIHIRGTQNLITAAQQTGVKRFVQMSALGTRPDAPARYHQSKWAAEEIVRRSRRDFTIFRPSIIYGPHDHFVNLFARMAKFSPVLPVMGDGQNLMQPVPVGDVAKCFVRALTEPKSIGQTYDLCGPERLTFDEILDAILEVTGRNRWKIHIPMNVARLQATFLESVFSLTGTPSPLSRDQLLMLQEDNVGDSLPAIDLFSLHPVDFKTGIATYLTRGT